MNCVNLENVLQAINTKYIALPQEETKRNLKILESMLDVFVIEMKKDPLFAILYKRIFYGGSFYDGVRVGKPEEFDLDLLLFVPSKALPKISLSNVPGFVTFKVGKPDEVNGLKKLVDAKGNLKNTLVRQWMEGIMTKVMSTLCPKGSLTVDGHTFLARFSKGGPAMTLHLNMKNITLDVDFVPCFLFGADQWPVGGYRPNPVPNKSEFFIVPKMPTNANLPCDKSIMWRLSFQEQERALINGKQFLKPAMKLLKRLRDQQEHEAVASYYIKTIFLWEVEANSVMFVKSTLQDIFLKMLKRYIEWLEKGQIPYFWNKKNNLLSVSPITLENIKNRLKHIHNDITTHVDNPFTVCQYLGAQITPTEVKDVSTNQSHNMCAVS